MKSIRFLFQLMGSLAVIGCSTGNNTREPINITAINEVFGDGLKNTGVILEYDQEIDNDELKKTAFEVTGRKISKIYANRLPEKTDKGKNGKYIIIELSQADKTFVSSVQKKGPQTNISEPGVIIKQTGIVTTTKGGSLQPGDKVYENNKTRNLVADDFLQKVYEDNETGLTINYNLFVPSDYDPEESYPLVLFMHDASVTGNSTKATLLQGNGATVWATPSEQSRHKAFVLAPQFSTRIVNDNWETTDDLDAVINLIKHLQKEYSIDKNRLYTTGQSGGCMMSIAMNIKYPACFAASYLVAGQWDTEKVSPMADDHIWIMVAEGDEKAYPGMNAITKELEAHGAKVSRAVWNGQSSPPEFSKLVEKMETEDSNIKYVALQKNTVVPEGVEENPVENHMYTWKIAYNIEGIRDWLFQQKNDRIPAEN
ncbi:prolyl oligopeptidase family serine peptidase [Sinomicrobium pectinilyticum]|nr:prolyl oligopeptidase family serine peptidase [Sinomicrobium pectinilyticum]